MRESGGGGDAVGKSGMSHDPTPPSPSLLALRERALSMARAKTPIILQVQQLRGLHYVFLFGETIVNETKGRHGAQNHEIM